MTVFGMPAPKEVKSNDPLCTIIIPSAFFQQNIPGRFFKQNRLCSDKKRGNNPCSTIHIGWTQTQTHFLTREKSHQRREYLIMRWVHSSIGAFQKQICKVEISSECFSYWLCDDCAAMSFIQSPGGLKKMIPQPCAGVKELVRGVRWELNADVKWS